MLNETENQLPRQPNPSGLAIIAKNSTANLAKMAAMSITVFFLPPILVRVLDKSEYATWMLILQIGTYVALFDGSIQSAISRFVARSRGLSDDSYLAQMLSSSGLVMLGAAVATAALTIFASWQLKHLFSGIPSSIESDAQRALFIFGICLAFSLPFSTLAGAFLGLQMNEVNAVAGSVGRILGASGAALAAYLHQSLAVMAIWTGFGYLLQALMYLLAWQRLDLHGFIRRCHVTSTALREFISFCYAIFATQLGGILITGLDMPIVAAFDFHTAAYYAIAATVGTMLTVPQSAVVNTMVPVAASISATASPERLGLLLIRTTRYSSAILCLLTLPLLLGMNLFLHVWVGSDYAQHTIHLAMLLVVAQFIRLTLLPYAAFGFAVGQQNRMLISPLGEGIVNLFSSLIGVHYIGAEGVALGTLIGACTGVILHFFNSMPCTNHIAFNRLQFTVIGIMRPLICCTPSLLLGQVAMRYSFSQIVEGIILIGGELLAFTIIWKFNFSSTERSEIASIVLRFAHA